MAKIKYKLSPGQVAIISGGSSGIGLATAKFLAAEGLNVWIVARTEERLNGALTQINQVRKTPDQVCGALSADVSDWEQALDVVIEVESNAGHPDLLINSAGVTHPGYIQELGLDIFRWMMDVNYFGTVNMIRAAMPAMISRGSGYIVNISSAAGFIGVFGYSAYSASKYAIRGLSDVMRAELKPHGVGISIVFPSDTDTPQYAYEEKIKPPETKFIGGMANLKDPKEVAKSILKGISKGDYLIFPSFDVKLIYKLSNLLGGGVYPIMDMLVKIAQNNNKSPAPKDK